MKKYIQLSGKQNRKRIFQSMELTRMQKLDNIQKNFHRQQGRKKT